MQYLSLTRLAIDCARARARQARADGRGQIGASAIEWAIISAVVVGLAIVIYTVIEGVVNDNADKIEEGSNVG